MAPLPLGNQVAFHSLSVSGTSLYLFGGNTGTGSFSSALVVYDIGKCKEERGGIVCFFFSLLPFSSPPSLPPHPYSLEQRPTHGRCKQQMVARARASVTLPAWSGVN